MDNQTLDKTLQDCNFDIDLAIEKLQELCIASSENPTIQPQQPLDHANDNLLSDKDIKWVNLFVQEMTCATSIDDAKARATRAFVARDQDQTVMTDQLSEKNMRLSQENCVLKRLVVLQHEKLKGYEEISKGEVEKLNGMLTKCKEELRVSEMNNYTLRVHLNHAGSSLISTFNLPPDVY